MSQREVALQCISRLTLALVNPGDLLEGCRYEAVKQMIVALLSVFRRHPCSTVILPQSTVLISALLRFLFSSPSALSCWERIISHSEAVAHCVI